MPPWLSPSVSHLAWKKLRGNRFAEFPECLGSLASPANSKISWHGVTIRRWTMFWPQDLKEVVHPRHQELGEVVDWTQCEGSWHVQPDRVRCMCLQGILVVTYRSQNRFIPIVRDWCNHPNWWWFAELQGAKGVFTDTSSTVIFIYSSTLWIYNLCHETSSHNSK